MTPAERLARIEAILERIDKKLDTIEDDQRKDIADLAALKNRGIGMLIGVGLVGGTAGAGILKLWQHLFH